MFSGRLSSAPTQNDINCVSPIHESTFYVAVIISALYFATHAKMSSWQGDVQAINAFVVANSLIQQFAEKFAVRWC